jgi:steroid 5-alpha reductase family enzyme
LGINVFFFLLAYTLKTDKFTDFTYGATFITIALYLLFRNQTFFTYQIAVATMIVIWAIRLITYLLVRILKIGKDNRFDEMREKPLEFFKFWFFQGISVWAILLPSSYLLLLTEDKSITPLMMLGIFIWLLGLTIESVADQQKFTFKNNPQNKGMWIESGLWKYSRHPNYFGEMLLWWGIFLFVAPFLSGLSWIAILGPLYITFILIFVSGIPPLEKRYDKKYADNEDYQEYKKSTSILVPLPTSLGKK